MPLSVPLTDEDVKKHFPMVQKIASRIYRTRRDPSVDFDDVFSEGCLALCIALINFDPSRGYTFSTFAFRSIYNRLQTFMNKKVHQIRYPEQAVLLAQHILRRGLEIEPVEQIAAEMGAGKSAVKLALKYINTHTTVSLDHPLSAGKESDPDHVYDYHFWAQQNDDKSAVHVEEFLDSLKPKERRVCILLMQGYNLREIAADQGCTFQNIHNISRKLRKRYESEYLITTMGA